MKKLSSTLPNMLLSLGGICVLVSGILAVVNHVTTAPIAEAEMKAKVEAIRAVAPAFDNNPFEEKMLVLPEGETDSLTVYPAKKGGALVGFAIESYTQKGFSGVDFSVLQHSESPGLGSRIPEWYHEKSEGAGIRDVRGLDMKKEAPLTVSKDGGKVDAITAATISSRAFLDAVNRAWRTFSSLEGSVGKAPSPAPAVAPADSSASK